MRVATIKTVLFWMLILVVAIVIWNFAMNFQVRP